MCFGVSLELKKKKEKAHCWSHRRRTTDKVRVRQRDLSYWVPKPAEGVGDGGGERNAEHLSHGCQEGFRRSLQPCRQILPSRLCKRQVPGEKRQRTGKTGTETPCGPSVNSQLGHLVPDLRCHVASRCTALLTDPALTLWPLSYIMQLTPVLYDAADWLLCSNSAADPCCTALLICCTILLNPTSHSLVLLTAMLNSAVLLPLMLYMAADLCIRQCCWPLWCTVLSCCFSTLYIAAETCLVQPYWYRCCTVLLTPMLYIAADT